MTNNVFTKLTGGRFIFTVLAAVVFAYMSITGMLNAAESKEIILIVVFAYFNRSDRQKI